MNQLEQLKKMTVVVADTGDMHAMKDYKPRDATTNPSLILSAADKKEYAALIDSALDWAKGQPGDVKAKATDDARMVSVPASSLTAQQQPDPRDHINALDKSGDWASVTATNAEAGVFNETPQFDVPEDDGKAKRTKAADDKTGDAA